MNISPLSNEFVLGAALLLGALLFLIQLFSISKLKKQLAAVPQVQASTLFEEKLSSLENKLEQSNKKVNHAHEIIDSLVSQSKTIKKSSLVRYNPFRDSGVGGLQSFSTASIDDNGDGVPEDELKDIFKPFYRVSTARDRSSGGTGLGLAITESAIHQHSGTIIASKSPLGGLRMTITLPIEQ